MEYGSKAQGVELFRLRGAAKQVYEEIKKACPAESVPDMLARPLTGKRTKLPRDAIGMCGEACERGAQVKGALLFAHLSSWGQQRSAAFGGLFGLFLSAWSFELRS